MHITVSAYNILHGFHSMSSPFTLDERRLHTAMEVVRRLNADMLGLTEACFGAPNPSGVTMDYRRLFDYPYATYGRWGSHEWGSCLLSRWPLEATTVPFANRTAIRARVTSPTGDLHVFVLHPDPQIDIEANCTALRLALSDHCERTIVLGDLNALSPDDPYHFDALRLGYLASMNSAEATLLVSRLRDSQQFVRLLGVHGLRDVLRAAGDACPTFPTTLLAGPPQAPQLRLDYIFCSRDIGVRSARTVLTPLAAVASDHYPIVATICIPRGSPTE